MEIKVGTLIWTPRFCTVKISAVFDDEREARVCGYTEPTYYEGSDCIVLGKAIQSTYNDFYSLGNIANRGIHTTMFIYKSTDTSSMML